MPEDKKLRQAVLIVGPGEEDEAEYVPSWSSQNRAMRALAQGVPQRPPGEEITGFDPDQARRIFSQIRRPFDLREERSEIWRLLNRTLEDGNDRYGGNKLNYLSHNLSSVSDNASGQTGERIPVDMVPSEKARNILLTHEGFSLTPYTVTPNDPLTIGIGHKILPDEDFGEGITEQQAWDIFQKDLDKNAAIVNNWARGNNVQLNQQQFDALVSFVFNLGSIGVAKETQIIADTIRRGDATPEEIRHAFDLYVNGEYGPLPGLVTRRKDEADLFLTGEFQRKD
jgi:GH24 family phage-related lysozyme (muramidase)